jgi:hypothetical protein
MNTFECILCGRMAPPEEGALDAVELYLGDAERGVCDDCFAKLPEHAIQAAEDWDARR